MSDLPLFSVVIPTCNSGKTLVKCLMSIKNQTYSNVEVIVVDKYSSDNTLEVVRAFGAKFIQGYFNKPEARNVGILNSTGDYVLIADADFVFESNLINDAFRCFVNEGCAAVYVPEEYIGDGFLIRCRNLEKKMYQGAEAIESPRIYKRWVFDYALFDERNQGPDEFDFYFNVKKFGIKASRIRSKILLAEAPLYLKKKFSHGKYFEYYARKHKQEKLICKQVSLSHRMQLFFDCFKYAKLEALGVMLLKALDFFSFTLGRFAGLFDIEIQRLSFDVKEEFDGIGEIYESSMYKGTKGREFIDQVEKASVLGLLKEVFSDEKIKVLDVGAGNGRWSKEFLKLGYNVTALDISPKMCGHLENTIEKLKVVYGNIESMPLKSKYDLVFSFRSFKYTLNRKRALDNIRTSLNNNGYLILEMPNKHSPFYFVLRRIAAVLYALTKKKISNIFFLADFVSENQFKTELEETGFSIKKTKRLFFFPHNIYSKINNSFLIQLFYNLDVFFSKFFPRSIVYVCK
jgi:glycosyltransferase involved in cell wall biosynthesis